MNALQISLRAQWKLNERFGLCEEHGGHCTTFVVVNHTDFMMARANPQRN